MTKSLFARIFVCVLFFGWCLYSYIDMQNGITELRIRIPELARVVRTTEEENTRLLFEIEVFENPAHLMELAQTAAFAHLKYPLAKEVITLKSVPVLKEFVDPIPSPKTLKPSITFATGVNP